MDVQNTGAFLPHKKEFANLSQDYKWENISEECERMIFFKKIYVTKGIFLRLRKIAIDTVNLAAFKKNNTKQILQQRRFVLQG
jgi:hypothetical protein